MGREGWSAESAEGVSFLCLISQMGEVSGGVLIYSRCEIGVLK